MIIEYAVIIIVSVVLHEMAHAYAGYLLGDDTAKAQSRISLNPLKHIDPVMSLGLPLITAYLGLPILAAAKPVPFNYYKVRWQEYGVALIALAGPLANFILAFGSFLLMNLFFSQQNIGLVGFFGLALRVNLSLMLFNLVPIPPLDGSRVLSALVPTSFKVVLAKIEQYGFVVIYGLMLLFGQYLYIYIEKLSEMIISFFKLFLF